MGANAEPEGRGREPGGRPPATGQRHGITSARAAEPTGPALGHAWQGRCPALDSADALLEDLGPQGDSETGDFGFGPEGVGADVPVGPAAGLASSGGRGIREPRGCCLRFRAVTHGAPGADGRSVAARFSRRSARNRPIRCSSSTWTARRLRAGRRQVPRDRDRDRDRDRGAEGGAGQAEDQDLGGEFVHRRTDGGPAAQAPAMESVNRTASARTTERTSAVKGRPASIA